MKTIAVTGATGILGRFVVRELQARGFRVRGLARPESDRSGFPICPEWVDGRLEERPAIDRLLDGVDGVVHAAFEHLPGRYRGGEGEDPERFLQVNLHAGIALVREAARRAVPRFVFLSSRAVFSRQLPGRPLDESHPVTPDTLYGASKAAVEAFVTATAHACGGRYVSLRATGVYGCLPRPEQSKWFPILEAVSERRPVDQVRGGTEVHGCDVARVVADLLADLDPPGRIVHASDLYVTTHQLVTGFQRLLGCEGPPPPPEPEPGPSLRLDCRVLREAGFSFGGEALLEQTLQELVAQYRAR